MKTPWLADRQLDISQAAQLIEVRWPQLAGLPLRPLAAGWDNWVFQVGDDLVFRFPRREVAVALALTEIRVLPALAGSLPLAIPNPQYASLGETGGETGGDWPFAGYRKLPGQTADGLGLTDEQRWACARPLAEFLRTLHGLPSEQVAQLGAPGDELRRLDVLRLRELAESRIERACERGLLNERAVFDAELAAASSSVPPSTDVLVHGDLHACNVIVDDAGRLSGVIDWGDCHRGDPAVDLAMAHAFLPRSAHHDFRETYGEISPDRWALARLRALVVSLTIAVYADDVGREAQCAEACWALRNMLAQH